MIQGINYAMVLILLAIGCIAFCIRKSPKAMLALAAYLLKTADSDIERERFARDRHEAWKRTLGIEQ